MIEELSSTDKDDNIRNVIAAANDTITNNPILVKLTICQAILEAGLRSVPPSQLALKYNNLFGIKGIGTGKMIDHKFVNRINLPTHEYYHGDMHEVDQMFAVNATVEDSFIQHLRLLELPRYAKVLTATTIEDAAEAVYKAGYATDPQYPNELLTIYYNYLEE